MTAVKQSQRACPVCGQGRLQAAPFMEKNWDAKKVNDFSFASRKQPEFMSHELVRCQGCDLVYAPEPPSSRELERAYHSASFDSAREAEDAADTYIATFAPALKSLASRTRALEIGAGTGAFLERLLPYGFSDLVGVEPSRAAIDAAPLERRSWMREGIFHEADFEPASFDLIACFMTLEHVADPAEIVTGAFRLLKPGGMFIAVTHDYRARLNRLLGSRSPIIDIEHLQLFSAASVQGLLARSGFTNVACKAFANSYSFAYWLRLTPLPGFAKRVAARLLEGARASDVRLRFNVGNIATFGSRPA